MIFSKSKSLLLIFIIALAFNNRVNAQLELVSASHPVYDFLKRMQLKGVIKDFNSSSIPISRSEVSAYLKRIELSNSLSGTDKKILGDYKIEFEYELSRTLKNSGSVVNKFDEESVLGNNKQKYIYSYADSNASLFFDFLGDLSNRLLWGDLGDNSVLLGDMGLRLRGTVFDRIGYSVSFIGGQKLGGHKYDLKMFVDIDPVLKANPKFLYGNNYFDYFNGYLRYQTKNNWLSLTLGREALFSGFGYIDKLFLSNNTVPVDFLKIDLSYKKLKYTFAYGSIKGDSLGVDLNSKNIAFHRLNYQVSDVFKIGYYETVIMSNSPFSFIYLNPVSFLTSADLSTGANETVKNNTLMGFDFEVNPVKNLAVQGSILIDDIHFSTLFKKDKTSADNKIGYQAGTLWTDAFTIPNLTFALEYTRLNPFVYSHRSNKDSYTHWDLSLGHALPPNSDEIALKLNYNITNRVLLNFLYKFQRSGQGIYYDSALKQIVNYGGNINRGDGDFVIYNGFLLGDRINRNIFTIGLLFEPVKQYFLNLQYQYKLLNLIYLSENDAESFINASLRINL